MSLIDLLRDCGEEVKSTNEELEDDDEEEEEDGEGMRGRVCLFYTE